MHIRNELFDIKKYEKSKNIYENNIKEILLNVNTPSSAGLVLVCSDAQNVQ